MCPSSCVYQARCQMQYCVVIPIQIRMLNVAFARNPTSAGGILNRFLSHTVVDSSFSTFATTVFALFLTLWATCSSELVGLCLLSPFLMTHIANFSSLSQGLSFVLVLPPQILKNTSCWGTFSSTTGCSGAHQLQAFASARSGDALLAFPLGVW